MSMDPRALLLLLLSLCFGLFLMGWAQAETFDGRRAIIIDGDTIAIGSERVRLLNVDAPESFRPRCDAELVAGLKAKERLAELLRGFPSKVRESPMLIERHGRDRYGRTLARLVIPEVGKNLTDGQVYNLGNSQVESSDVGEILITEGLALPWRSGSQAWEERRRHWCG